MKEELQSGIIATILVILVAAVALTGIGYVYWNFSDHVGGSVLSSDANVSGQIAVKDTRPLAIRLAEAKATAQTKSAELAQLKIRADAEAQVLASLEEEYQSAHDTLAGKIIAPIKVNDSELSQKIAAKQSEIIELLNTWKQLISPQSIQNISPQLTLTVQIDTAKQTLAALETKIQELENIIKDVTPDNSGLTEKEIQSYKDEVKEIEKEIVTAEASVKAIEKTADKVQETTTVTTPQGETKQVDVPLVTPGDIATKEKEVEKAEEEVKTIIDEIADTTATSTSSTTVSSSGNDVPDYWEPEPEHHRTEVPELLQGASHL